VNRISNRIFWCIRANRTWKQLPPIRKTRSADVENNFRRSCKQHPAISKTTSDDLENNGKPFSEPWETGIPRVDFRQIEVTGNGNPMEQEARF
jgi:hypothetical protein